MNEMEKSNKTFENIKHIDEEGNEFWYARELMQVLSYKDWRYFEAVIEKAKIACENSEISNIDHFVVSNKMVEIGSGNSGYRGLYNGETANDIAITTFETEISSFF